MREVAEVVEAEEARQGEETPTTAVKVVGPVEGPEVVVGDEPWDRSIPRLWMGPVTSTISSDRKRGHVPTDSTAPCVTLRLPNLPEAHHQHNSIINIIYIAMQSSSVGGRCFYKNTKSIISFRLPTETTTIPLRNSQNLMENSNFMVPARSCAKNRVKFGRPVRRPSDRPSVRPSVR